MATATVPPTQPPHQLVENTFGPSLQSVSRPNNAVRSKTTMSSNASKRPRAERPCDGCRRRKAKCVVTESRPCDLCRVHGQQCTFVEGPPPRRRKVEPTTQPAEGGPSRSKPLPPSQDVVLDSSDPFAVLAGTLSMQRFRHCRHVGSSAALDPALLAGCQYDNSKETRLDGGSVRRVADSQFFEMLPDVDFPAHEAELQALQQVEQMVAPHGAILIDLYFDWVHPSFPIVQKRVFLDRHRNDDRQFSAALLAAMYVLAIRWWDYDPVLSRHPAPSTAALESLAMRSLLIAMQRPKLSSLQAGLLLLQKYQPNAWPLTVQLVALSQELGLHLDCSSWSIPAWEIRLRRRLAWAIFMQDKWGSLVHGRPSHMHAANWAVTPLTEIDFNEATSTGLDAQDVESEQSCDDTAISTFLQLVELTSVMSEVIDTFYTPSAIAECSRAGPHETQLILTKAKPVQLKLKEWFARLPSSARMECTDGPTSALVGHLHLAYFATEICIHRRIVHSLSATLDADNYILYMCRSAAKTRLISAMDFVNRLQPEHLDAFWYFPSANNFALIASFGNLLRSTAPGAEEAEFYEMRLKEYRWALAVSARRAVWIDRSIGILDVMTDAMGSMREKPRSGQASPKSRADSALDRDREVR